MAKPLLRQKCRHLHAACTVVAQTGNGLVAVQVLQAGGDGVHHHLDQLKPLWLDTGSLHFPRLAHIQHHGCAVRGLRYDPVLQLGWLDLVNHAAVLELEAGGFCKAL